MPHASPVVADAVQPMSSVTELLVRAIESADLATEPFEHIYMPTIFRPPFYERLLDAIPGKARFKELRHRDALRDDGSSTRLRMYLYPEHLWSLPPAQRAVWMDVSRALRSTALQDAFKRKFQNALETRFGRSIDMLSFYPIPILVCDEPGYRIGIHTDVLSKVITVQFYLPRGLQQRHMGTIFHHGREGEAAARTKTMPFAPGSGYAFAVVQRESWHSVAKTTEADGDRYSIMLTYYVQDGRHWLKRRYDRFRTFLGFGPKN